MVANRDPFCAADDANILDRQDGEEEVLIGPVVPVLVHLCSRAARANQTSLLLMGCCQSG